MLLNIEIILITLKKINASHKNLSTTNENNFKY